MLDLVDFVFAFPFTEITGITITHITEERWNMVSKFKNKNENEFLAQTHQYSSSLSHTIFTQNK